MHNDLYKERLYKITFAALKSNELEGSDKEYCLNIVKDNKELSLKLIRLSLIEKVEDYQFEMLIEDLLKDKLMINRITSNKTIIEKLNIKRVIYIINNIYEDKSIKTFISNLCKYNIKLYNELQIKYKSNYINKIDLLESIFLLKKLS